MKKIYKIVLVCFFLFSANLSFAQIENLTIYRKPCPSLSLTFDLQNMVDLYSLQVAFQIYDPLFTVDDFLQIKPHLVESFEQKENGRIYTIHLKPNIKFHNGKTLTSDDVIYTLERFIKKNYSYSPELQAILGADAFLKGKSNNISGLQKISDSAFRMELQYPVYTLFYVLSTPNLGILPNKLLGLSESSFFSRPIGTGPFKVVSYSKDKSLELEKNEFYFLGKPKLDKLIYEYATKQQAIDGFNKGYYHDLQWVFNPKLDDIKVSYNVTKIPLPSVTGLIFNTRRGPFLNASVRKYVTNRINTDKLFEKCFSNNIRATDFIPYGLGGHNQNYSTQNFKNKGMINRPTKLSKFTILRLENHPCHNEFDRIIQDDFKDSGVAVEIRYITYQDFVNNYFPQRNYDVVEITISADYPEALSLLNYFRSDFPGNPSNFGANKNKYDELMSRAINISDKQERYKLYQDAENILFKDAVIIPVYYNIETIIFQKNIEGIVPPTFTLSSLPMRSVYFKE